MFKLKAKPTFRVKCALPIPGEPSVSVEIEFRHKTRVQLVEWGATLLGRQDGDVLEEIIANWSGITDENDVPLPFSRAALEALLNEFPAAAKVLSSTYTQELADARLGN